MARVVVQRVRSASVDVGDEQVASIGAGCAILVGIADGDTESAVDRLADKQEPLFLPRRSGAYTRRVSTRTEFRQSGRRPVVRTLQ